jgi:hypothetical protein
MGFYAQRPHVSLPPEVCKIFKFFFIDKLFGVVAAVITSQNRLMVTNPANSRGPLFKPSEFASLGYLGAAQRAERGRSISEPNREVNPHPLYF